MKKTYLVPQTEAIKVCLGKELLIVSDLDGAQTSGFTDKGSFDDGDWDID